MSDRLFLGHITAIITAAIQRHTGVTQYAAGDVIATEAGVSVIELSDMARAAGSAGMIVTLDVIDSANQATKPSLEVWLFSSPPANIVDNAPFTPTDAELAYLVAVVQLTTSIVGHPTVGAAGNCVLPSGIISRSFKCEASLTDLYAVLVTRNAYTPIDSEIFTLKAAVLQDFSGS